jgi:hypothetical protein
MNVDASFTNHSRVMDRSRWREAPSREESEDGSVPSLALWQTLARITLTIALMAGMSALFAAQIYATLR